jgi:mannitol/fructose-specific phosphotransferase system IIA component (Ntr-type)
MAMTEVVVEIELTLKELQRPLDASQLLAVPGEDDPQMARNARMCRYITVKTMIPELHGVTKTDVISELVHVLTEQGLVRDEAEALSAVLRREEAMSTGLRHGFACPHGRTTAVDSLVCAIGMKSEGLPFDSMDQEPTRLILLVLSPVGTATPYMELMASMNGVFGDEGREALLACRTPQDMHDAVVKRLG